MKFSELFETPQFIMPTSFNLDNKRFNRKHAKTLLGTKNKHIVYSIDDTTHLYEFNTGYAIINSNGPELWYYVRFKVAQISYIGKPCVQQIKVWRDFTKPTKDIAKTIFFKFLLPKFGCMITDAMQTEDGQRFWFNRIHDAFDMHLHVYFISLIPPRMIKLIGNYKELQAIISDTWDWTHKYQAKRIVITDRPLQEKQDEDHLISDKI